MKNKILYGLAIILLAVGLVVTYGQLTKAQNTTPDVASVTEMVKSITPENQAAVIEVVRYLNNTPVNVAPSENLGGLIHVSQEFFVEGLESKGVITEGGGIYATTSKGSLLRMTFSMFDTENVIDVTPGLLASTDVKTTLPASTSLTNFLKYPGQVRGLIFRNTTSATTHFVRLASSTGVIVTSASTTSRIAPGKHATLNCYRKTNTDISCFVTLFRL